VDHHAPVKIGRVTITGLYTDERRKRPFVYRVLTYPKGRRRLRKAMPVLVDIHDFYDTAQAASHREATITQLQSARKGAKR
jgi:hypothetical protein